MITRALAFLAAVLVALALSLAALSWFELDQLAALGAPSTLSQRMAHYQRTLVGFGPTLGAFLAASLFVTLLLAGLAFGRRAAGLGRVGLYAVAGAVAPLLVFFGFALAIPILRIHGADAPIELGAQALAGAMGGAVYALFTRSAAT